MPRIRAREVDTPQLYTHRDIRSRTHAHDRLRKQSQKYYGYRGVDPEWVGQEYLECRLTPGSPPPPFYFLGPAQAFAQLAQSTGEIEVSSNGVHSASSSEHEIVRRSWTRSDMFAERESGIWPLDRRHHISKRKHTRHGYLRSPEDRGIKMKQKQRLVTADDGLCVHSLFVTPTISETEDEQPCVEHDQNETLKSGQCFSDMQEVNHIGVVDEDMVEDSCSALVMHDGCSLEESFSDLHSIVSQADMWEVLSKRDYDEGLDSEFEFVMH